MTIAVFPQGPARGAGSAPPVGAAPVASDHDPAAYVTRRDGLSCLTLAVDGMTCAACVQRIERELGQDPQVRQARVNFTTRRLTLAWEGEAGQADGFIRRLGTLGYEAHPFDDTSSERGAAEADARLLRALALAGFGAGNVMWMAIAVWAGLVEDMTPATRLLFYWAQALISLPVVAYAGQPFFASAWAALKARSVNMDVPITVGVLLTTAMSMVQTVLGERHAYFDAALSLLFLLLVGRFLDQRARGRARSAATQLLSLRVRRAARLTTAGQVEMVAIENLAVGDLVQVAAGERIPVDGVVISGVSTLDNGGLTGESLPEAARPGTTVFAGAINLSASLIVDVRATGEQTLLADIIRCMETAEQGRARYVMLADRLARYYVPVVHGLALATFIGWFWGLGAPWHQALLYAVATLIITCPCALGIAVPVVQVVASGRLFKRGILLKSATALERLAEIDTIVFDKTGTLTEGRPLLVEDPAIPEAMSRLAAGLAATSRHPLCRALLAACPAVAVVDGVQEYPGDGLEAMVNGRRVRLGRRGFVTVAAPPPEDGRAEMWLETGDGSQPWRFSFVDRPRVDAVAAVAALASRYRVLLLSGDRPAAVAQVAESLGISDWQGAMTPRDKVARLDALKAAGRRVLMVGDGLNDAPALGAAHASMAPAHGADVSRSAADVVFQGVRLGAVGETLAIARRTDRLVRQNLALSLGYNLLFVPLAVCGTISPLVASIAMSVSSLTVIGNALRFGTLPKGN